MLRIVLVTGSTALAALTACSSSGTGYGSGGGSTPASAGAGSSAGAAVTISLRSGVLTGPDGHTLYVNTVDTANTFSCTGACAAEWPPVTGTGTAGSGLSATDLGTTTRPDGTTQVTFHGHPLYAFKGDSSAGQRKGEGLADAGGTWHAATAGGSGGGSSSSGSGGGYGSGY